MNGATLQTWQFLRRMAPAAVKWRHPRVQDYLLLAHSDKATALRGWTCGVLPSNCLCPAPSAIGRTAEFFFTTLFHFREFGPRDNPEAHRPKPEVVTGPILV